MLGVLLLAVAGCGDSEEDRVKETLDTYFEAFVDSEGDKACELLSDEARRDVVRQVGSQVGTKSCGDAMDRVRATLDAESVDALEAAEVQRVQIDGDRATVTLETDGRSTDAQMERVGGDWRVSAVPG